MSFITATSSLLSLNPRVWTDGRSLCARTNLLLQTLSLFSYSRRVVVDPVRRVIDIRARYLWFIPVRREVPFGRVEYIEYAFSSFATSWGGALTRWESTDQVESFTVRLSLIAPRDKVDLFSFRGEGAIQTGAQGVLLGGDKMVDWSGDQEERSRSYVRALSTILNVPLGGPPISTGRNDFARCVGCRKGNPPWLEKCQYCGGRLELPGRT